MNALVGNPITGEGLLREHINDPAEALGEVT
jgi:hypothetical protein